MTAKMPRRARFRQILNGDRCVYTGSVSDPLSARIAENLGFECGIFAGSVGSLAVLGAPDLIVMTLTEFAEQAYRICRAGDLPLLVDADHGYGNALNVRRTVEELEHAGVCALSIEDTVLPRGFGAGSKPQLISIEEGVGKMKAALAARRDPDLVIAGRTSAAVISGIGDAIARARAYEVAGVDAIFLVGLKSRAELDAAAEAIRIPIILGGAGGELSDRDYLASRGVRVCLLGHRQMMAAAGAVHDTLKAQLEGRTPPDTTQVASADFMKTLTRDDDYARWTKDFLG
jgi:carboxyvinyl-carboxyphosphonate phosphorylmutase